ncbi:olfactory receptor 6C1-like [Camelus ferus]|uniref:Olfactory receptor 6C1-like n=1 Tax=Camelus ferus TaxID=419612 RepID=A0A8B8TN66_CAMFR|nr:olfactory receptor 6C1-like [Camelus ferus]
MPDRAPRPGRSSNGTAAPEFVRLGVTDVRGLQLLLLAVLLVTHVLTLPGNLLIVTLTVADRRLATPMPCCLRHSSLLEPGCASAVTPQALVHLLTGRGTVSRARCFSQTGLCFILGTAESLLPAVTSADRYPAVCRPLRCPARRTAGHALAGAGVRRPQAPAAGVLPGGRVHPGLCRGGDRPVLRPLSGTVLHLPSSRGRRKASSTCPSPLLVVALTCGSCLTVHLSPRRTGRLKLNRGVAFFSTIVSPLLNPFVYCLRNELVQKVSRDLLIKVGGVPSKTLRA